MLFRSMTYSSPESNIMEVHKAIVSMTRYSKAELWQLAAQYLCLPVRALHVHDLIFPPRAILSKSSQDQSVYDTIFQCWKAEFRKKKYAKCLLLPGRACHVHDFIFPTSPILWKYTSSLFILPDIQCWKKQASSSTYLFASSSLCLSRLWLDPPESNIEEEHKVTVFLTQYSNAERSSQQDMKCSYLPIRVFQVHDFIFPRI